MKSKPTFLIMMAALALMLTAHMQAQTTDSPYLNQFPSVERVKVEIKGSDAIDTAARQNAAFWWLNQIIMAVSGPRGEKLVYMGDVSRIRQQYLDALHSYDSVANTLLRGDYPRWEKLTDAYKYDPQFGEDFLKRFFTPDFRAGYYRFSGKQPPPASEGRVPTVSAKATGSTDGMDIAKAKAAKVDTAVFGMQLGDPHRLRECPIIAADNLSYNCGFNLSRFGLPGSNSNADPEVSQVRLAPDFRPDWMAGYDVDVRVHDGLLVGVYMLTKGRNAEKLVNAELRAKYGPASGAHLGTITPDTGNPFNVSNPEWNLPGIHVEYEVVQVLPDEDRVNLKNGVVRVETAAAYKRRMDKRNAPVKRKM